MIRLDQGNPAEAEAICRRALERYPGNVSLAARLARVFWRQDRHDEAAAALKEQIAQIAFVEWRKEIAREFIEEFAGSPAERVAVAVASISNAGFHPAAIQQLSYASTDAEQPELAFQLLSSRSIVQLGHPILIADGYRALRRLRGPEEALRWIDQRVPGPQRGALSQFGYEKDSYELSWDFVPDPVGHSGVDDYVWLVRAASYWREGASRSDWRARLDDYYSRAPGSFYDQLGAMLLGRLDPSVVWSAAVAPDQRVEAAYFIGVRAEASGDLETAIAWYRIALESGLHREGETQWSLSQLYRLRHARKSVERLRTARGATAQYSGT